MASTEKAAEDLQEQVSDIADDSGRWTQEESAEIFEMVAEFCKSRADLIRQEMNE